MNSPETRGRTTTDAPRAPGWPLVGNAPEYLARPLGFLIDCYRTFGPVFRISAPMSKALVIAGTKARAIMSKEAEWPLTRAGLFRAFSTELGLNVFEAAGEEHRQTRSQLKFPYSKQVMTQFAPDIEALVHETASRWSAGQHIDLFESTCRLAAEAMMKVLTPIDLRDARKDFSTVGNLLMYVAFRLAPPIMLALPHYQLAKRRMYKVLERVLERHARGEFASDAKVYIADACLQVARSDGGRIPPRAIRGMCIYPLAAAEIYVGRLVGFMLYELLKSPHDLKKVLAEIDTASRAGPLSQALRHLPHLRAVYFEALRCYPLVPGHAYIAAKNFEVDGIRVPRGQLLAFAPGLAHFDSAHFFEPGIFQPARHLPPRKEFARNSGFAPFGIGPHACLAQGMVETMTLILVASFLKTRELTLVGDPHRIDLRMRPLIEPKKPVRVRVGGIREGRDEDLDATALSESPDFEGLAAEESVSEALPQKGSEDVEAGEWLIREGDVADSFFVLLEGRVSIWKSPSPGKEPAKIAELQAGESFGEIGLLKRIPRTASVRTEVKSKVLRFAEPEFEQLLSDHAVSVDDIRAIFYRRYVKSLLRASLKDLPENVSPEGLRWQSFEPNEYVFRQGAPADAFFMIVEGLANVIDDGPPATRLAQLGPGDYFGEMGILRSQPRNASVQAETLLKTLVVGQEDFMAALASAPHVLQDLTLTVCRRTLQHVRQAEGT